MKTIQRRQIVMFVRHHSAVQLAQWTEYEYNGRSKTELIVWKTMRTILPRDRVAYGIAARAFEVSIDSIDAWLNGHGYEVLSRLDGPPSHQDITYF